MQDETPCDVTHRQIVEGLCPLCDHWIENGQLSGKSSGPPEIRWNWGAVEECLRDGDRLARSHTVWHLSLMACSIDRALPLLALALTDTDQQTLFLAETVCSQIGRDITQKQVAWLETQRDDEQLGLAARMILLGKYFLSRTKAARAARATHIYWMIEHHPDRKVAGNPDAACSNIRNQLPMSRRRTFGSSSARRTQRTLRCWATRPDFFFSTNLKSLRNCCWTSRDSRPTIRSGIN